jgi:hypothetical protein
MTGVRLKGSLTDINTVYSIINDKGIDFKTTITLPIGKSDIDNTLVEISEDSSSNYRDRTYKNASADATIAFAINFESAGEKATKTAVLQQGKKYIKIDLNESDTFDMMLLLEN